MFKILSQIVAWGTLSSVIACSLLDVRDEVVRIGSSFDQIVRSQLSGGLFPLPFESYCEQELPSYASTSHLAACVQSNLERYDQYDRNPGREGIWNRQYLMRLASYDDQGFLGNYTEEDYFISIQNAVYLREIASKLPRARYTYSEVEDLALSEERTLELGLSADFARIPAVAASRSGSTTTGVVPITPIMEAELTAGSLLRVEPVGSMTRRVSDIGETRWTWKITALGVGPEGLKYTMYLLLSPDSPPIPMRDIVDEVTITSSMYQDATTFIERFMPIWAFFATVVPGIGAAIVWLYSRARRSKRNPGSAPMSLVHELRERLRRRLGK